MSTPELLLVGLAIVVGLVGVVVPVLPGALLVVAAIGVWALVENSVGAWTTFGLATAVVIVSQVVKYVVPGRRLRDAGVPRRTLLAGAVLGIIGFFVIPVVGLFVGFVLGVYAAERQRLGGHDVAWPSARDALKAVGLSVLIELAGALLAAGTWLVAVLFVT